MIVPVRETSTPPLKVAWGTAVANSMASNTQPKTPNIMRGHFPLRKTADLVFLIVSKSYQHNKVKHSAISWNGSLIVVIIRSDLQSHFLWAPCGSPQRNANLKVFATIWKNNNNKRVEIVKPFALR